MVAKLHDLGTKVQAFALAEYGVPTKKVADLTGLSMRSVTRLKQTARQRGYDPETSMILLTKYVEDAPRSGRPKKITPEQEKAVVDRVKKDRYGREMSTAELGGEFKLSPISVLRILHKSRLRKQKPTWKPGLTEDMRKCRLMFAETHKDWTIEDWKKVIWSDETSVILGHRQGGTKVWRTVEERYERTCIRRRWKGCSEFM